jgi:hypothetical protein
VHVFTWQLDLYEWVVEPVQVTDDVWFGCGRRIQI